VRRRILWVAAVALCTAMQLVGQQSHPPQPLEDLLRPRGHAGPAPVNAVRTSGIVLDANGLGSPLKLDKGWRVGITANEAAAMPDFDDSAWAVRDARGSFADVPDEDHPAGTAQWDPNSPRPKGHRRPSVWFRCHLNFPPNHKPVFLLVELPPSNSGTTGTETLNIDVFANGRQVQPEGPHGDGPGRFNQISRIYDLHLAPSETALTIAVRSDFVPVGWESYTNFFANRKFHVGSREDLDRILELWYAHNLFERIPMLVNSIMLAVIASFLLALHFTQKGHPEYLWLALFEILHAPIGFVDLAGSFAHLDHLWSQAIVLQLLAASAYVYFEFLVAFLALPRRWNILALRYTAPLLAGIAPTLLFFANTKIMAIALAVVAGGSFLWVTAWIVFIVATLVRAALRRNFEAGLLLIPLFLSMIAWMEALFTTGMSDWGGRGFNSPLTFHAGPIPIRFGSIADFAGIFVIILIVFVRFLRIQRDQERASSELAAARSVQELMIPRERPETPGYEVDSIYTPANEVGGDFYHVEAGPNGGLLVVIGDVAGKGLKAAMNVSMLMGALRRAPEIRPAKILAALNRVLSGSESFTTCQAAWFGADGEVVLANAGHLPPYLNSQEVAVPGSLPLGVLREANYEEVRLYLHPGDRVLLLSDGVVEARKPSGELFGFDRVHNLSNQSAFYIADAAKSFGQEDDITVLTVRRLAEVAAD
jgi:sigma-B regulation protein RsbU (phosphoserine phosphatase)